MIVGPDGMRAAPPAGVRRLTKERTWAVRS
jgi:hypothetical protein